MNDPTKKTSLRGNLYIQLWRHISDKKKRELVALISLIVLASFLEVVAIGSLIPLVTMLASPETIFGNPLVRQVAERLAISSGEELVVPMLLSFAVVIIFASALRVYLTWYQTKFSSTAGSEIASSVFSRTLLQPYSVHLQRNSSQIISALTIKTNTVLGGIITPVTSIFTSVFLVVSICGALVYINPQVVIYGVGTLGTAYCVVLMLVKSKLLQNSQWVSQGSNNLVKIVQENLGGIRDLIVDGYLKRAGDHYSKVDLKTRLAAANSHVLSMIPRYFIETIGILAFLVLAVFLSNQKGGLANALPVLAAFAVGLQRLLPILQQIYASVATILASNESLVDVIDLLDQEYPQDINDFDGCTTAIFNSSIMIKDLYFNYPGSASPSLKGVNFRVKKGSKIGVVGSSGSGKSTLIDLLMGLTVPTSGSICIDDVPVTRQITHRWQRIISHVPQAVFLADTSIAENVAFGQTVEEIDYARVTDALKKADLLDYVHTLPEGILSHVGEHGARMSGGQRQRLGLSRALYKQSQVLFLDEATSALDSETESKVIDALVEYGKEMTVFVVAHRTETLAFCDQIFIMEGGQLIACVSYEEFLLRGKSQEQCWN